MRPYVVSALLCPWFAWLLWGPAEAGTAPGDNSPRILYVDALSIGGTGESWKDSLPSLDEALALAIDSSGFYQEIRVARGTYCPASPLDAGDPRTATFRMAHGLAIHGGYDPRSCPADFDGDGDVDELDLSHIEVCQRGAGVPQLEPRCLDARMDEDDDVDADDLLWAEGCLSGAGVPQEDPACGPLRRDQRDSDPRTNGTVLSGDRAGDDEGSGDNSENCYNVVTAINTDLSSVLDGFTVSGGNANGLCDKYCMGGGLQGFGSATIRNCIFRGNHAHDGGGLCLITGDSLVINTRFLDNRAEALGGGVMLFQSDSRPLFINCVFAGNAAASGGAVYGSQTQELGFSNCSVSNNAARPNGGGVYLERGHALLANTILWGNRDVNLASEASQFFKEESQAVFHFCCVQRLAAPGERGNIDVDPRFRDPATGDLSLQPGSSCIDAGDNIAQPVLLAKPTGALETGEWAFVAAVYDGTAMRIYKNASEVAFRPKSGPLDASELAPAWIGSNPPAASSRPWAGTIDEVAIFDRALNGAALRRLYRAATSFAQSDLYRASVMQLRPLGYWRLDEADGEIASDQTSQHPGYYRNGVALNQAGALAFDGNPAAVFDGEDDYVDLGALDVHGSQLTILAWVRADRLNHLAASDARIVSKAWGENDEDHFWMLSTLSANGSIVLRFRLKANGHTSVLTTTNGATEHYVPLGIDLLGNPRRIDILAVDDPGRGDPPVIDIGAYEAFEDCNSNQVPDLDDIQTGTSRDCDLSGIPDECEPDSDADGLIDACDRCDLTLYGLAVDGEGCPPQVPGDWDRDGDVDSWDTWRFEQCATGPAMGPPLATCSFADLDGDGDVDHVDFGLLQSCYSGEGEPANPYCLHRELDCNDNHVDDQTDLLTGFSVDCNNNQVPDECEPDADGDLVPDVCDVCAQTVPGSSVDPQGCPPVIPGDHDRDGDVDHDDLTQIRLCLSGEGIDQPTDRCQAEDFDADADVDLDDFGVFQRCLSGTDLPADLSCLPE